MTSLARPPPVTHSSNNLVPDARRHSDIAEKSRICDRRNPDAWAWHRRQHRSLLRRRHGARQDAVVSRGRSHRAADDDMAGTRLVPGVSAPKFTEWRRSTSAFEEAASYRIGGVMNLTERDQPEQVSVAHVSVDFFRLFGARVARGRTFTIEEDRPNGPYVVVVTHEFWQRQMGETPNALGERLSLDGDVYRVIGVLEPGFDADSLSLSIVPRPELWLPLQLDPNSSSDAPLFAAARMRDGITLRVAQAQTDAAATRDSSRLSGCDAR